MLGSVFEFVTIFRFCGRAGPVNGSMVAGGLIGPTASSGPDFFFLLFALALATIIPNAQKPLSLRFCCALAM